MQSFFNSFSNVNLIILKIQIDHLLISLIHPTIQIQFKAINFMPASITALRILAKSILSVLTVILLHAAAVFLVHFDLCYDYYF